MNRTYAHGDYQHVMVQEKKRRDLAVASVRDRVVHRYVYDQLVTIFDHSFDPDVWSCRTSKGLHKALNRTQLLLCKYPLAYIWRSDITKFFDHIRNDALLAAIARKVNKDSGLFWLCRQIIASYDTCPATGIPIGNLTSQIFSNIYLNEFDRYVRHTLKPLSYLRYGDDFVLFCSTRRSAHQMRADSEKYLASRLGLSLNPKNDVVVPVSGGLHFLGHVITKEFVVTDRHTSRSALTKVSYHNLASYRALNLAKNVKKQLNWKVIDEISEIIDTTP